MQRRPMSIVKQVGSPKHNTIESVKQVEISRKDIVLQQHSQDVDAGYPEIGHGDPVLGWLVNIMDTSVFEDDNAREYSAVAMYFMKDDGSGFKASIISRPYFYIAVKEGLQREIETYLMRVHTKVIVAIEVVERQDLALANHLSGINANFLKLEFDNMSSLMYMRGHLQPIVRRNKARRRGSRLFANQLSALNSSSSSSLSLHDSRISRADCLRGIIEMREYDVPYLQRIAIDENLRAGLWYEVVCISGQVSVTLRNDLIEVPDLRILAFDIETTKSPLKFPDAAFDEIMMISYMADGEGFLIVNRSIVSEDIDDFEYTPKPDFPGPFTVFNESNEHLLLERFLEHISDLRPHVFVTYNGDFFDWPFVDTRCTHYGISMYERIGIRVSSTSGEYYGRFSVHLDAFCWVRRDSYLPQGSQGLKAVTKALLKYNPLELDPEQMLPFAASQPQTLASYSVSDAVATYFLYLKFVHLFVFSLCKIIPMSPADVLRKGSGTLCEQLLMVEAYRAGLVCPNKQRTQLNKFWNGRLLESETYIGGHVESLESGIFREDIPVKFRVDQQAIRELIDEVPDAIKFAVETEWGRSFDELTNGEAVCKSIIAQLQSLLDAGTSGDFERCPLIYHLDVGAMYPNIILTNRLQPMAMVDQKTCASCDFNVEADICQRPMQWRWRGKHFTAEPDEVSHQRAQLGMQSFRSEESGEFMRYNELPYAEQAAIFSKRVKEYSQKMHRRANVEVIEEQTANVCQRENSFYVDTVRAFRDRRYEYKALKKKWAKQADQTDNVIDEQKAKNLVLLYDSMQLAHKCILNSFYGYVMRKGARWYSMEMAGVVTHTGANIIKDARVIVEKLGRALELDTDGIWCLLPSGFPETFELTACDQDSKVHRFTMSYPGTMLNRIVDKNYTNTQYLTLSDVDKRLYTRSKENSIFFEVDGPYRAMILPAASEEGKTLKKRYAVYNRDGSLAELKGFEIKRRGELRLIKVFQEQVFPTFLAGSNLDECYAAVGKIANHWLDIIDRRGVDLDDEEVFDLISESKNLKNPLASYGDRRSTSTTTAKRLAEFLGQGMVKDKGLACRFIISIKPEGDPVSLRAVPTAIFSAEPAIRKRFLCRWLRDPGRTAFDIRSILDWQYYKSRLSSAIQKIVTIPATLQMISNPCSRVVHPDWLLRRVVDEESGAKQQSLRRFFNVSNPNTSTKQQETQYPATLEGSNASQLSKKKDCMSVDSMDIEDFMNTTATATMTTEETPDIDTDFKGWHMNEKKRWKIMREQQRNKVRTNIRNGSAPYGYESESAKQHSSGRMDSFIQRSSICGSGGLLHNNPIWHILHLFELPHQPGNFLLWVYSPSSSSSSSSLSTSSSSSLHCVNLSVPREFFVRWRNASGAGTPTLMTALGSRQSEMLHHIKVSENIFVQSGRERASLLSSGDAEAFYECEVPLWFRAIVRLGTFARVKTQHSALNFSGSLDQIDMLHGCDVEYPYLDRIGLKQLFLFTAGSESRAIVSLLYPAFNTTQTNNCSRSTRALVIGVSSHGKPKLSLPCWSSYLDEVKQAQSIVVHDEHIIDSEPIIVSSMKQAFALISSTLTTYAKNTHTRYNSMVVCQSSHSSYELSQFCPALGLRLPFASILCVSSDNEFDALNWLHSACKIMMLRYIESCTIIDDSLEQASYTLVPLCNLVSHGCEQSNLALDVMYARVLSAEKHVLWADASDTIGNEEKFFSEELTNPQVISSGCYRGVCAQIGVMNVAISAMLSLHHSTQLDEHETINVDESNIKSLHSNMDTHHQCKKQRNQSHSSHKVYFRSDRVGRNAVRGISGTMNTSSSATSLGCVRALRKLIQNIYQHIVEYEDQQVDKLLSLALSWIRSRRSLLHSPIIYRVVHEIMRKLFIRICAELRDIGAHIVYASFSRIIVSINKPTIRHAKSYLNFAYRCMNTNTELTHIVFDTERVWHTLLFMDKENYAGVISDDDDDDDDNDCREQTYVEHTKQLNDKDNHLQHHIIDNTADSMQCYRQAKESNSHINDDDDDDDDNDDDNVYATHITARWSIFRVLPRVARDHIKLLVSLFIQYPLDFQRQRAQSQISCDTRSSVADTEAALHDYVSELVAGVLQQRLFSSIQELLHVNENNATQHSQEEGAQTVDFVDLPGVEHIYLSNVPLYFIKLVTHVFALDSRVTDEVSSMRSAALQLIDVRAFSLEAQCVELCHTFVLPDVVCSFCGHMRDLDMCRDEKLLRHDWSCDVCAYNIDHDEIEEALVDVVHRRNSVYQVQDLVCNQCARVQATSLNQYCECNGTFECRQSPFELQQGLQIFRDIARYHSMAWLSDTLTILEA